MEARRAGERQSRTGRRQQRTGVGKCCASWRSVPSLLVCANGRDAYQMAMMLAVSDEASDSSEGDETRVRQVMIALSAAKEAARKADKSSDAAKAASSKLDRLIGLVTELTAAGFNDVYEATREDIDKWRVAFEKRRAEQQRPPSGGLANLVWHYKLTPVAREVHGPFTTDQMREWYRGGFFKPDGDVVVRARFAGDERTGFKSVSRIDWKKFVGI